jgi:hypothetical protein
LDFCASLEPNLVISAARWLFYPLYGLTLLLFGRAPRSFILLTRCLLLGYLAHLLFNTGVHGNHSLLPVAPAVILAWLDRRDLDLFLFWALAANIDPVISFGLDGGGFTLNRVVEADNTIPLAALYLLAFS